jgi:hypothetical protein
MPVHSAGSCRRSACFRFPVARDPVAPCRGGSSAVAVRVRAASTISDVLNVTPDIGFGTVDILESIFSRELPGVQPLGLLPQLLRRVREAVWIRQPRHTSLIVARSLAKAKVKGVRRNQPQAARMSPIPRSRTPAANAVAPI